MKKIIIWGIGKLYNQYQNTIRYFETMKKFKVVGVVDKNMPNCDFLDGYKVLKKHKLLSVEFDYIIVMSEMFFCEIVNEAIEIGIKKDNILSFKIMNLPISYIDNYYLIKDEKVSFISNNCFGGLLYNTLGLECLSPFKNLFVKDDDYINLICDFKTYMSKELIFSHYDIDPNSKKKYCVMKLDNIEIHCNHDDNPDIAKEKWDRRVKKINYDNIVVEMYTENIESAKRFSEVNFEKKIVFFPHDIDIECSHRLVLYPGQNLFFETVNRSATDRGCFLELLPLLMGEVVFRTR